jgi:hypothetical protein
MNRRDFLSRTVTGAALLASSHSIGRSAAATTTTKGAPLKEARTDVLVVGASLGGVAAALAAARMGRNVILTEEVRWIGGQATTQGVPLDEHPWIESFGCTRSYRDFRSGVRDYYRTHYPLTPEARRDPTLNPGAGWVSALCYEPRVGLAVLNQMLAPHFSAGRIQVLTQHRPVAAAMDGDRCRAVTLLDETTGNQKTISAPMIIDGTELGDLLPLARMEHVVGAESRAQTGEPNALDGPAEPLNQMQFTHIFALDHLPGEDHTIARPRDYDAWRTKLNPHNGKPKLPLPDLFGGRHDYYIKPDRDPKLYAQSTWNFRRILCRENFVAGAFPSDVTVAIWTQNAYNYGPLCGVSPAEQAKHFDGARQLSLSLIHWLQTEAPNPPGNRNGFPGLRPRGDVFGTDDGLAQYPYVRESRRIKAEFTVLEQHFRTDGETTKHGPTKYHDSVGLSGYRVDIHKPAPGGQVSLTISNHGKHWCQQIPLGALIPVRVENILPACKNLGVTAVTNGAFRVHPTEWNIGEAAGALAAFCLERKLAPRQVRKDAKHLADFQREIVRQGFELDWPNREFSRSYFSHVSVGDPEWYFGEAKRLKQRF